MSKRRRTRHPIVSALLFAVAMSATSSLSAARANDTEQVPTGSELELEFTNAPAVGMPLIDVPRLTIGIGDRLREAVVDTGSTGVVLSASSIPNVERLPSLGPGIITYSSSGRVMSGHWVVTPLVIAGRSGRIVTRPMPILAVDAVGCTATARHCTPNKHPSRVAMLGIGFGREHDRQPGGTPDRNPLLNVAEPALSRRSYVITRHGIRLSQSSEGFTVVGLTRDTANQDWSAPAACISLDQGKKACGTVLVDTGITGMYLTVPADSLPAGSDDRAIPPATAIAIDLAPAAQDSLRYAVRSDTPDNPRNPSSVVLSGVGRRPTFVNTGAHFLNRFDYLYDADAGIVGYRPVGSSLP